MGRIDQGAAKPESIILQMATPIELTINPQKTARMINGSFFQVLEN
jgi:hypothetical protein